MCVCVCVMIPLLFARRLILSQVSAHTLTFFTLRPIIFERMYLGACKYYLMFSTYFNVLFIKIEMLECALAQSFALFAFIYSVYRNVSSLWDGWIVWSVCKYIYIASCSYFICSYFVGFFAWVGCFGDAVAVVFSFIILSWGICLFLFVSLFFIQSLM